MGDGTLVIAKNAERSGLAVAGYVGLVAALSVASSLTGDTAGPALNLIAAALTLPAGVLIYPALYVNLLVTGAIARVFNLDPDAEQLATVIGVNVVFCLAALLNAVLVRAMGQTIRGLRR